MKTRSAIVLLILAGTLRLPAPPAPATTPVLEPYITHLQSAQLGQAQGTDTTPTGQAGAIRLAGIQHGVSQPLDPASGASVGARRHSPFTVIKQVDHNTPWFYRALATGAELTEVRIQYFGRLADNTPVVVMTYTLTDARVVNVRNWQPNANDPAAPAYVHPEEVSFSYATITWEHPTSGAVYTDTWGSAPP